ncbi:hypothetical protein HZA97_01950 [Candidatus Woesearchaeota archaeon]|nr:hypothetical protein [Candidatus Woesearchaeota archaeon]
MWRLIKIESDLDKKIKSYLDRAEKQNLEKYLPEEVGHWIIITGESRDSDRHPLEEVLYGKFIDAIAYAVQRNEFYTDRVLPQIYDPGNSSSGMVKKIHITKLT